MQLKPIYLCVLQEEIDGNTSKEFLHEMSDSRLRDLTTRRTVDGSIYYSKDVRETARMEIDRRNHNALITRAYAEIEFRADVVNAMVNAGMSKVVAEKLTNDVTTLMDQAKKFGVI